MEKNSQQDDFKILRIYMQKQTGLCLQGQLLTFPFVFEAKRLEVNSWLNWALRMVVNGKSLSVRNYTIRWRSWVWGW